jgi:hypothetical protein
LTDDESDELMGLALGPTVIPLDQSPAAATEPDVPPQPARSGASGAAVINELVDEIEKDLERNLDRHAPPLSIPKYGRTIGCWVAPLVDEPEMISPGARKKDHEEVTE